MKKRIKEVIKSLADKAESTNDSAGNSNASNDALKYSQAALNLAHTLSIVVEIKKQQGEI